MCIFSVFVVLFICVCLVLFVVRFVEMHICFGSAKRSIQATGREWESKQRGYVILLLVLFVLLQ